MALTLTELCEVLAEQVDEVSLLELLEIDSFELVERFKDKIENRFNRLSREYENF